MPLRRWILRAVVLLPDIPDDARRWKRADISAGGMRKLVVSLALVALGLVAWQPVQAQSAESVVRRHCASEWPDDYQMRAYCEKQQREALATLEATSGPMSSGVGANIRAKCAQEWPEDFAMRVYCEKQQVEAVRSIQTSAPSDVPADVLQQIRAKCAREWPDDYAMRAYCEKQQVNGYRTLQ